MCLIVNNYKIDISMISTDLGITLGQSQKFAKELGARIEKQSKKAGETKQAVFATLVLPLAFPQRSRGQPA